jgi:DNA-binding YbaB/EbfC family protein
VDPWYVNDRGEPVTSSEQPNPQQQLLQQVQQMQQDLLALNSMRVEGSAGGGLVTASVTGAGELVGLTIDPKAVDPNDTETLADLVLAAVRDANRAIADERAKMVGELAQGFGDLVGPGALAGLGGMAGGLGGMAGGLGGLPGELGGEPGGEPGGRNPGGGAPGGPGR